MKKILFLLFFTLGFNVSAATKDPAARKVLDATAAHLSKAGGMSIKFTATTLIGKQSQGSTSGTMNIQGQKFHLNSPDMLTWFNGKSQWSMIPGDDEVSLSEPTAAELQAMNPYAFLSLYKKGFNYKMKRGTLTNGKNGYKIFLTADNKKQDIREMYLEVDNAYNPVRVSIRQGKNNWTRIVINSFQQGKTFKDSEFEFPEKDNSLIEIIDLR